MKTGHFEIKLSNALPFFFDSLMRKFASRKRAPYTKIWDNDSRIENVFVFESAWSERPTNHLTKSTEKGNAEPESHQEASVIIVRSSFVDVIRFSVSYYLLRIEPAYTILNF